MKKILRKKHILKWDYMYAKHVLICIIKNVKNVENILVMINYLKFLKTIKKRINCGVQIVFLSQMK